jgi:hypothetical protein
MIATDSLGRKKKICQMGNPCTQTTSMNGYRDLQNISIKQTNSSPNNAKDVTAETPTNCRPYPRLMLVRLFQPKRRDAKDANDQVGLT